MQENGEGGLTSFDQLVSASQQDEKKAQFSLSGIFKIVKNAFGSSSIAATSTDRPRSSTTITLPKEVTSSHDKFRSRVNTVNELPNFGSPLKLPKSSTTSVHQTPANAQSQKHSNGDDILGFVGFTSKSRSELLRQHQTSKKKKKRNKSIPSIIVMGINDEVFERSLRGLPESPETEDDPDSTLNISKSRLKTSGKLQQHENALSSLQAFVGRLRNFRHESTRRDYWVSDETSTECYQCKLPFTTFRRKHHCRICGQVFCNKCASFIMPGKFLGTEKDIRVCDYCARIAMEYNSSENHAETNYATVNSAILQSWNVPSTPQSTVSSTSSVQTEGDPSTHQNSFDTIRRLIAGGPSIFSSKFWGSSPQSTINEEDLDEKLPFRKNIEEEDRVSEISGFASSDNSLVEFFSQNHLIPSGKTRSPTVSSDQLITSEVDERSSNWSQKLKRRMNSVAVSKYSAKALRNQLNVLTDPQLTMSSVPSTPMFSQTATHADSLSEILTSDAPLLSYDVGKPSDNPVVELSYSTFDFMRMFLRRLTREFELSDSQNWENVIVSFILKMCHNLSPNVKDGDSMNITKYIKIKKIPGNSPSHSIFVQGIVVTKNVMHKKMLKRLKNPRILLLAFPLEFYRTNDQYMSLGPVLSQEREHLKNLVNRIMALKPDLIIVEKTVSRVALEFLQEEEVSVVSNMKSSVMESISMAVDAEIIVSMEKITLKSDAKLGTCKAFSVESFTDKNGTKKTCMFIDGCLPEKYCTLLIAGPSLNTLKKVKEILKMMCSLIYNLKLEFYLFKDQCAVIKDKEEDVSSTSNINSDNPKNYNLLTSQFETPYINAVLSSSPNICFPVPYLIKNMKLFEMNLYTREFKLSSNTHLGKRAHLDLSACRKIIQLTRQCIDEFMASLLSKNFGDVSFPEDLPIEIKRGLNYILEHSNAILSPLNHQNLLVLYCNVNTLTSLPCHPPSVIDIRYYQDSDMTLGQYLEELCFDSNYLCPEESCQRPMLLHFRSYAHYNARVNVIIEEFPCPIKGMEEVILMWSFCKVCGAISPVSPMSEWTARYSFGKYLEISFYHSKLYNRYDNCSHIVTRDHVRYFGLKNTAVRFEYEEIDLFEVFSPSFKLQHKESILKALKEKELDEVRQGILSFYHSILERIRNFNMDELHYGKLSDFQKELAALGKRVPNEKSAMLQLLQDRFLSTPSTDLLALNSVRKVLYDNCCEWDKTFAELLKKFVIPEKSDKRLTLASRLFQDRDFQKRFPGEKADAANQRLMEQMSADLPPFLTTATSFERWINSKETRLEFADFPTLGIPVRKPIIENEGESQSKAVFALESEIQKAQRESLHAEESLPERRSRISQSFRSSQRLSSSQRSQGTRSSSRNSGKISIISSPPVFADVYPAKSIRSSWDLDRPSSFVEPFIFTSTFDEPSFGLDSEDVTGSNALNSPNSNFENSGTPTINIRNIMAIDSDVAIFQDHFDNSLDNLNDDCENIEHFPSLMFPHVFLTSPIFDTAEQKEDLEDLKAIRRSTTGSNFSFRNSPSIQLPASSGETLGERNSILKTFRDFTRWIQATQGGSTTSNQMLSLSGGDISLLFEFVGLAPLNYPFVITDHCIPDSDIIIREDEPTSIIAFALHSKHYNDEIKRMLRLVELELQASQPDKPNVDILNSNLSSDIDEEFAAEEYTSGEEKHNRKSTLNSFRSFSDSDRTDALTEFELKCIEHTLRKTTGTHIRYEFPAASTKCSCSVYFAEQFDAIRRFVGCESGFVQSLSRCLNWNTNGGQSGSSFFKTRDDRFFMKQLSKAEMEAFLRFAPAYFEYISQAFFNELPTVMVKLLGVYRIGSKNSENGRSRKIDVVVMENLFYERKPSRIFDLKGSRRNRHVQATGKQSEVLLDENLVEIIGESPLFIREHSKRFLKAAVWNDTLFLSKLNVMDYSLLVGIDEENHEFIVGIVDFIRTFTWDKKLESWVKETGILGGGGKEPTIVSPRQYKSRFRESMDRYFLMVPDKFCNIDTLKQRT